MRKPQKKIPIPRLFLTLPVNVLKIARMKVVTFLQS
jgi:hypothetical protein